MIESIGTGWMWVGFGSFILIMLALDLYAFGGRKAHTVRVREALAWSLVWITLALSFNALLWLYVDHTSTSALANARALEFFTGYLLEKSLSVDNMFVFLMIFNFFAVPAEYQRRVLVYGVLGAILLRTLVILFGSWLLHDFHWILYLFGAFLLFTGIKMLIFANKKDDLSDSWLLNWLKKHLRITPAFVRDKFIVKQAGQWFFTPLFLVLIFVEVSDLIFAVDSVPAVFAVTNDPFIVWTSNIFAILGLRALYFLLANLADRFHFLKYGLAVILSLIGAKMLLEHIYPVPIGITLGLVGMILGISVIASLLLKPKQTGF